MTPATLLATGTCKLKNERYCDVAPGRLQLGKEYAFERVQSDSCRYEHWIRIRNEKGQTLPVTKREFERFFLVLAETATSSDEPQPSSPS